MQSVADDQMLAATQISTGAKVAAVLGIAAGLMAVTLLVLGLMPG